MSEYFCYLSREKGKKSGDEGPAAKTRNKNSRFFYYTLSSSKSTHTYNLPIVKYSQDTVI